MDTTKNKMLIDSTHPEETRVVVLRNGRVEEFDWESAARKLLRGNIYLAKVTRVEPSLQAAFVDYGGNRHGFLAFSEIHPDYYQIPVADRQELVRAEAMLEEAKALAEAEADAALPEIDSDEMDPLDAPASPDEQERPERGRGRRRGRRDERDNRTSQQPETIRFDDGTADHGAHDQPMPPMHPLGDEVHHGERAEQRSDQPGQFAAEPRAAMPERTGLTDPVHAEPWHDNEARSGEQRAEQYPPSDHGHGHSHAAPTEQADQTELAERTDRSDNSRSNHDTIVALGDAASDTQSFEPSYRDARRDDGADQPSADYQDNGGVIEVPHPETNGASDIEVVGAEDAGEEIPDRPRRPNKSYKIQEVIKRRQIILVQVVKEERGNKGAALTTYLSLAGRYTVLMPNTARGGGISRKITNPTDRKRLRKIVSELEVPQGMGLIVRTAGASRTKAEIKRDFEYLLRVWESVRDLTLRSTAPTLVYEEGDLIKRSIRDLYSKEIDEIVVAGEQSYKDAHDFMQMLMPSHTRNVIAYRDPEPLFTRYQIERQLNAMFNPTVTLRSGGYIVINQTEALVAIDVNSGKATREHNIEDTAFKTNLEASEEIARQLKLRDLAGLIVIDFIDMEEKRNQRAVERRVKESLRHDRARIQVGRISHFGLLEMSRQRLRPGVLEGSTSQCPHCQGTGSIRSTESIALAVLRGIEDKLVAGQPHNILTLTTNEVALYILNQKRQFLNDMEARHDVTITVTGSEKIQGANFVIERGPDDIDRRPARPRTDVVQMDWRHGAPEEIVDAEISAADETDAGDDDPGTSGDETELEAGAADRADGPRRSRRRRRRRNGERDGQPASARSGQSMGHDRHGNGHVHAADGPVPMTGTYQEPGLEHQTLEPSSHEDDFEPDDDVIETAGGETLEGLGDPDGPRTGALGRGGETDGNGGTRDGRRGRKRGRRGGRSGRGGDRNRPNAPSSADQVTGLSGSLDAGLDEQPRIGGYEQETPFSGRQPVRPVQDSMHGGRAAPTSPIAKPDDWLLHEPTIGEMAAMEMRRAGHSHPDTPVSDDRNGNPRQDVAARSLNAREIIASAMTTTTGSAVHISAPVENGLPYTDHGEAAVSPAAILAPSHDTSSHGARGDADHDPLDATGKAADTLPSAPQPAVVMAAIEDPNRPRRTGWWQRRLSGGE